MVFYGWKLFGGMGRPVEKMGGGKDEVNEKGNHQNRGSQGREQVG